MMRVGWVPPLWRCFLTSFSLYLMTSLPGTHQVQEFLLNQGVTDVIDLSQKYLAVPSVPCTIDSK